MTKEQEQIAKSIISKISKKEAEEYLKSGELPAIELTGQEMELLKAGQKIPTVKEWFEGLIKSIFY
jgi:hypothetical protein